MTTKATKIKGSKKGANEISPLGPVKGASRSKGEFNSRDNKDNKEEIEGEDSEDDEEDEDDQDDDGVPLSDVDLDAAGDDIDVVPYQKVFKDNHSALTQALSTFALPWTTLPFAAHQSITSSLDAPIDVDDDLARELAFYKQAIDAAQEARTKLLAEGVPFGRPSDYFAEMIKDDEHMEKIRHQIVEEEAKKKASEAAKRQRDLKKFGKQVQVSKIQEREKQKGQVLEKIKALKRKRQDGTTLTTEDDFDVELEEASHAEKGPHGKMTRDRRNEKYGQGGSKKKFKRNDDDAGDLSVFDKRGKGGRRGGRPQRPGKSRRMQQR